MKKVFLIASVLTLMIVPIMLTGCLPTVSRYEQDQISEAAQKYYNEKYGINETATDHHLLSSYSGLFPSQTENILIEMSDNEQVVYMSNDQKFYDTRQADTIEYAIDEIAIPSLAHDNGLPNHNISFSDGEDKTDELSYNKVIGSLSSEYSDKSFYHSFYDCGDIFEYLEEENVTIAGTIKVQYKTKTDYNGTVDDEVRDAIKFRDALYKTFPDSSDITITLTEQVLPAAEENDDTYRYYPTFLTLTSKDRTDYAKYLDLGTYWYFRLCDTQSYLRDDDIIIKEDSSVVDEIRKLCDKYENTLTGDNTNRKKLLANIASQDIKYACSFSLTGACPVYTYDNKTKIGLFPSEYKKTDSNVYTTCVIYEKDGKVSLLTDVGTNATSCDLGTTYYVFKIAKNSVSTGYNLNTKTQ